MNDNRSVEFLLIERVSVDNLKIETLHIDISINESLVIDIVPDPSGHKTTITSRFLLNLKSSTNDHLNEVVALSKKGEVAKVSLRANEDIEESSIDCAQARKSVVDWMKYKVDQSFLPIVASSPSGSTALMHIESKYLMKYQERAYGKLIASSPSWKLDDGDLRDLVKFSSAGHLEPAYWSMMREVWENRHDRKPGTLLIAYSALEVSIKNWYSHLYPSCKWLIFSIQSPPLEKILQSYVSGQPLLP